MRQHDTSAASRRRRVPMPQWDSEPTVALVHHARAGRADALDALMSRSVPRLEGWARNRLPRFARGHLDTCDLVQDVAIRSIARLHAFEPSRGSFDAYLRCGVMNRIRDEIRRAVRRPAPDGLDDEPMCHRPSPAAVMLSREADRRYRQALGRLKLRDRRLVIARLELGWPAARIASHLGLPSPAAARVAAHRALQRLAQHLD
ncbi:MAG: sigma-70 family RNA polymerase sigma factor [Vicinamibacterales bacterium]